MGLSCWLVSRQVSLKARLVPVLAESRAVGIFLQPLGSAKGQAGVSAGQRGGHVCGCVFLFWGTARMQAAPRCPACVSPLSSRFVQFWGSSSFLVSLAQAAPQKRGVGNFGTFICPAWAEMSPGSELQAWALRP